MTQQIINIGTVPNDGTGDPVRIAFGKDNSNFTDLYSRSVNAKDYGCVGDGVTDDTVAFQAALNSFGAPGGTLRIGTSRYAINSGNLVIPQGVFVEGIWQHLGERTSDDYTQVGSAILLNPSYTIQIAGRDAGIRGVAVINKTLTTPTTLRNVLDGVASFSGTGITVGTGTTNSASDFYLGHLFIMGFAQGIHINGNQERPRVEYIAFDCTAGYLSDNCSDVGSISHMRCWPYYAAHLGPVSSFNISNCANNGSGLIRVTCATNTLVTGDSVVVNGVLGTTEANGRWIVTVINATTLDLQGSTFTNAYASAGVVYARGLWARNGAAYHFLSTGAGFNAFYNLGSYGYDIGISIDTGEDYDNLIGCWADNNLAANDPTTIGVYVHNSSAVSINNHTFSSQGTTLKIDVTGRSVNRCYVSNSRIFGSRLYTVQLLNGTAHFVNCTFGGAAIRSEAGAGQMTFINCDLSLGTPFSYASQTNPRAVLAGCITTIGGGFQATCWADQAATEVGRWSGPSRAVPAASDQIFQSFYMMNNAGSMVETARIHNRINNITAGSENGEYYLSLVSGGALTDMFSWTITDFHPLGAAGAVSLGNAGQQWGTFYIGGGNQVNWNNGTGTISQAAGAFTFGGSGASKGAITSGGAILSTSPSGGVGYATGAGGTVTQLTSRTTPVTINTPTGDITMFSAAGSTTPANFTVNNSSVAGNDTIILNNRSGATNVYNYAIVGVAAGSFTIAFWTTGGTATDAPVIAYSVIKGATS